MPDDSEDRVFLKSFYAKCMDVAALKSISDEPVKRLMKNLNIPGLIPKESNVSWETIQAILSRKFGVESIVRLSVIQHPYNVSNNVIMVSVISTGEVKKLSWNEH